MTFKKFSRAGLVALAGAILLAIVLSLPTFHGSYAQTPATTAAPATPAAAAPAAAEAAPPACDSQDAREMHAQFGRHRLDAHLDGHRADDDHSGPGPVLRRHGAQEERRRHGDDELRHHLPDQHPLAVLHLQPGVPQRHAVHRRVRSRRPAGHRQRHLQGRRGRTWALPTRWRRRFPRPSIRCSS